MVTEKMIEALGAETTVDDHLRNLIQLMKRGGRVSVTDIPNDPTFLSSNFGGPTVQAMAEKIEAALSPGAEPVAIYKGNGLIDCGDGGHHNIELLKLIPANTHLYMSAASSLSLSTDAEPVKLPYHCDVCTTPGYGGAPCSPLCDRAPQPAPSVAVRALDADDVINELSAMPCETEGVEDLEVGCCRTCRARSIQSAVSAQVQDVAETEAEIVERMVKSVRDPFPSVNLSVSRGIDGWRELMRDALRAAAPAAKLEEKP